MKSKHWVTLTLAISAASLGACATAPKSADYTAFRQEAPRSILVVPALNNTTSVTAPDWFLSTLSAPFAERGYYVFPANMVRGSLNESGLSDAGLIHSVDARRLGTLFGCDAVLLININKWNSKYVVISTVTEVEFEYQLKSCKTNAVIWSNKQALQYSPQNSNGGGIAGLVAQAIVAALEKAAPSYMPLARQANLAAATLPGMGLPAGPYRPNELGKDGKLFPTSVR
jgi:hypothetical protein